MSFVLKNLSNYGKRHFKLFIPTVMFRGTPCSISNFRELFASSGACAATKRGMESLLGRPGGVIRNFILLYALIGYLAV